MMSYLRLDAERIRAQIDPSIELGPDLDGLLLIYAVLLRTVGTGVQPQHVHDAWSAWQEIRGRSSGDLIPFDELGPDVQRQDDPFVEAIRAAAAARSG